MNRRQLVVCFVAVLAVGSLLIANHPPVLSLEQHPGGSNATSVNAPPVENRFIQFNDTDYNVGPAYDVGVVQRAIQPNTTLPESLTEFIDRCTDGCNLRRVDCTGFVIRGDDQSKCYLKRFAPIFRVAVAGFTTYLRLMDTRSREFDVSSTYDREIVFGVLAHARTATERLIPALNTWLCEHEAVLFFEDDEESRHLAQRIKHSSKNMTESLAWTVQQHCSGRKHFMFAEVPVDPKVRSFNGAWKDLPLVRYLARTMIDKKWFVIVDDDTYIFQHNLNLLLTASISRMHDPLTSPVAVGVMFTDGTTPFVQGGAGIVLSRMAMLNILERYAECFAQCVQWAGDIRLGCCYQLAAVPMMSVPAFSSADVCQSVRSHQRNHGAIFPISFHQLKNADAIYATHRAESLSRRGAAHSQSVWWRIECRAWCPGLLPLENRGRDAEQDSFPPRCAHNENCQVTWWGSFANNFKQVCGDGI